MQGQALYERLMAFEIDEPGALLTFARRLARENGWSLPYAERVIGEYKRFLFLAMTAEHVVTPSEQVDQAWHLHLTYTRSYWDRLCGEVLGQPLHHGPTQGGAAEQAKFVGLYEQTLASYRQHIGAEPPADIWPAAGQRFGEDLRHVTVNTARNWIIPKPRWPSWTRSWRRQLGTPAAAVGLIGFPLMGAAWNPLDWKGAEFLGLYATIALAALVLAVIVRVAFAPHEDDGSAEKQSPLNAYEIACLWSGPLRAVHASFAALVQAGFLRIVDQEQKAFGIFSTRQSFIQQGEPLPANAPQLEQALYSAAALPVENFKPLAEAGLPLAQDIEESLRKRGLLRPAMPAAHCVIAGLIMAAPLMLGLAKIAVGVSRGRPVGFLIAACVATVIAALVLLLVRSRLTAAGRRLVEPLTTELGHTRQLVESAATTPSPAQLALLVGLFGVGVLSAGPLARVHAMLPTSCGGGDCSGGCSSGGGCGR
jgi:uncharacterized protein (TIGR04222 family)